MKRKSDTHCLAERRRTLEKHKPFVHKIPFLMSTPLHLHHAQKQPLTLRGLGLYDIEARPPNGTGSVGQALALYNVSFDDCSFYPCSRSI
jgi:hypothetical protein